MMDENTIQGDVTHSYNQFIKRKKQLINCFGNIYFNKKCLHLNIFPKYTKIIVKNNNNNKVSKYITQAQYKWIKDEISNNYRKIDYINKQLINLHLLLANTLDYHTWNNKYINMLKILNKHKTIKFNTNNKKLKNLLINSTPKAVSYTHLDVYKRQSL